MRIKRLIQILPAFALWVAGGSTAPRFASSAAETDTARRLQADVSYLASDELEGRGTPSRGLNLAALYLQAQLQIAGVEPAAGNSYLQVYKIGEYRPGEARVTVSIDGQTIPPDSYVLWNIGRDPAKGTMDLELVNAGNGVVAEERKVDDLAGLDVRGKAVVVRKGASWPLDPSQVLGPDRALGKIMAATVRGAELLVYLSEDLDTSTEAEAGFLREMKNAPVAFMREAGVGQASALNPVLVLKPQSLAGPAGADPARLPRGPLGKESR